jgi:sortase A
VIIRGTLLAGALALAVSGCAAGTPAPEEAAARPGAGRSPTAGADPEPDRLTGSGTGSGAAVRSQPPPWVSPRPAPEPREPLSSDGRPREATLTIPALGLDDLRVVPYRGSPDDAPGTRIQDGGVAASPGGPDGGVGPGGVGNYIVTAHRTSSTRAFEHLPDLRPGQRVHVRVVVDGTVVRYTYEIVRTRWTSFRSERSLEQQSAEVPGRPGLRATRAMITLSTCATPEDHARGNYWADEFGNPEHRIDKIGRLVRRTTS